MTSRFRRVGRVSPFTQRVTVDRSTCSCSANHDFLRPCSASTAFSFVCHCFSTITINTSIELCLLVKATLNKLQLNVKPYCWRNQAHATYLLYTLSI